MKSEIQMLMKRKPDRIAVASEVLAHNRFILIYEILFALHALKSRKSF